MGNAHPSIAPYELFEAGEGELVIGVGTDRQFTTLCEVIGSPQLASDERFASNQARVQHRAELRAELESQLAREPAEVWAKRLIAARVPAGVVNDLAAAFALAQSLGLDPIVSLPREDGSAVRLTRNPIALSETAAEYRTAPPALPTRGEK
jgi:crotonobetainyl-CoA:carnitine CoA-transferase CaiB-like acyl-CoA transferase